MTEECFLAQHYATIPENVEILLTHGPAYSILDEAADGHLCGSEALAYRLQELDCHHFCGHIHEGYGQEGKSYNAAIWDHTKNGLNSPWVVEL